MATKIASFRFNKLVADGSQENTPPDSWSSLTNALIRDGVAHQSGGTWEILGAAGSPFLTGIVQHLTPIESLNTNKRWWIYTSLTAGVPTVYVTDGTQAGGDPWTITPPLLGGLTTGSMTSGVLNGQPFLNGGLNGAPFAWVPAAAPIAGVTLTGWPAATVCHSMRAYGEFLVALRIATVAGTEGATLWWSDRAPSGALPTIWAPAVTNEAGSAELGDGGGNLVDAAPLGSSLMIYKEHATYQMNQAGLPTVMDVKKVLSTSGIINRNCVQEMGGVNLVVNEGDVIQTDGRQAQSIIDGANRRFLFDQITQDNKAAMFTAVDKYRGEFWVCYPGDDTKDYASHAMIWNGSAWGHRELQGPEGSSHAVSGFVPTGAAEPWDGGADRERLIIAQPGATNSQAMQTDTGDSWDSGTAPATKVATEFERVGLRLTDNNRVVTVSRVWISMESESVSAPSFSVRVGSRMDSGDLWSWSAATVWQRVTDQSGITINKTGRQFAIEITQDGTTTVGRFPVGIAGVDFEYTEDGRW